MIKADTSSFNKYTILYYIINPLVTDPLYLAWVCKKKEGIIEKIHMSVEPMSR